MYIQNAITCPSENKIAIIHTQYVLEERAPGPHKQIPRCSIPHANNNIRYSASCDRGSTFGGSVFWLTALLNPKSSLFQSSCVGVFFVVDLSHGIVHRAIIFIFLKISFWVRHRAPQVRSIRKKSGAPLPQQASFVHTHQADAIPGVRYLYQTAL